jgi:hypothetical protein
MRMDPLIYLLLLYVILLVGVVRGKIRHKRTKWRCLK